MNLPWLTFVSYLDWMWQLVVNQDWFDEINVSEEGESHSNNKK